jgi:DMSO/TMAO reductase YedYZ molybdopterin-dependent catalytic subunit
VITQFEILSKELSMRKLDLCILTLILILTLTLPLGCSVVPGEEPAADDSREATLTVKSAEKSITLTWDDIKELPTYEGPGGRISSVGNVTPPVTFRGVTVEDLCGLVGGFTEENSVQITAKDGYGMTYSYDQIVGGNYDTYDPSTGENRSFDGKLWTTVAYEEEGEPIPADVDGPLRLALLGTNKVVTDGHWWIKWVTSIEVKQAQDEWTLHLEGELTEEVDSASFETCAAPSCHGSSWTDEEGRTWQGVPLWSLVGRVDDENKHEDAAFNDDLAEAGYDIQLVASDGYSITLASGRVARDNKIILAYLLAEEPLPEKYWPLRLIGPDLEKSNWIGGVDTVEVESP